MTPKPARDSSHKSIGIGLIGVAVFLFVFALILLITTTSPFTILISGLSLIVGLTGFRQLEIIPTIPPAIPVIFEIDLIGAVLKSGIGFHVTIELTFSPPEAPPYAQGLIKSRLQRTLNMYGSKFAALPDDPYTEIESILQFTADPICEELGVNKISVKVIKVEVEGAPQPASRGIHFVD